MGVLVHFRFRVSSKNVTFGEKRKDSIVFDVSVIKYSKYLLAHYETEVVPRRCGL